MEVPQYCKKRIVDTQIWQILKGETRGGGVFLAATQTRKKEEVLVFGGGEINPPFGQKKGVSE